MTTVKGYFVTKADRDLFYSSNGWKIKSDNLGSNEFKFFLGNLLKNRCILCII